MLPVMDSSILLASILSLLAGILASAAYGRYGGRKRQRLRTIERRRIEEAAEAETEQRRQRILLDAKERAIEQGRTAEAEFAEQRRTLAARHEKQDRREENLQSAQRTIRNAQTAIDRTRQQLAEQRHSLALQQQSLKTEIDRVEKELCRVAGLSADQAKSELLQMFDQELQHQQGRLILKQRRQMEESADRRGRDILLTAIQRFAASHATETTTSTVDVPTDDIKGRIIGREGRNIRSFEKCTGVDLIIDDTPGVVIVSAFDPVRREIARLSLSKLIFDGRIHPSKIEEVVEQTREEIDEVIVQKGTEAIDEINIAPPDPRVIDMLGRLHFRTSYSQNILRHSVEVAFIAGMVAEMIGMDATIARRCGLFHDIGKAADHELEGGHPKIGGDLLQRAGEDAVVVHAARGHHDEIVCEHPYTMITAVADACSASRPGARRESLERYVKRMEELEQIAKRFDGVRQAFAVSAGRELRVIVDSEDTDDQQAALVCHNIAKAFEEELTYPGEIKVTVLRESRFVEMAQ